LIQEPLLSADYRHMYYETQWVSETMQPMSLVCGDMTEMSGKSVGANSVLGQFQSSD